MEKQKKKSTTGQKRRSGRSRSSRRVSKRQKARRRREILVIIGCTVLALVGGYAWSRTMGSERTAVVNEDVMVYEPLIEKYAREYEVSEFVPVILAMVQQESSGQGTDVMQCSECFYNTEYEQSPGSIADPEYSIKTGIRYFTDCLELAECSSPSDTRRLKLALQGYNFGHNYINWAIERDGGYTEENARAFSDLMKENLGWEVYGDTEYPAHVLRYYRQAE